MKVRNTVIGILIILFAVFGILEVSGVIFPVESYIGEISFFKVIALTTLCVLIIISISHRHVLPTVMLLALGFMVIEDNLVYLWSIGDGDIINNWALLGFSAVICIGLAFILPKKKKSGATVSCVGIGQDGFHSSNSNTSEHALGSYTEYIDCASFTHRRIENNLGRTAIRFENVSEYKGGATLSIENNLGSMEIYVPNQWRVRLTMDNNLGGTRDKSNKSADGPELFIKGENNLGGIDIVTV